MNWIALGTRIVPYIVMAIQAVEQLAGAKKGKEKQDAAMTVLAAGLGAVEAGLNKDLLDDAEVQQAVRAAIDAYVHLQNVIAKARAVANPI